MADGEIGKITQYVVTCKLCNEYSVYDGWRQASAVKDFRIEGWRKRGKYWFCPNCSDGLRTINNPSGK